LLTSITKAHQSAGLDTPATTRHLAVSETLKGIRRTIGTGWIMVSNDPVEYMIYFSE
jgi:hypothetical protein